MQGPLECGVSVGVPVGPDWAGLGVALQRGASEGTSRQQTNFQSFSVALAVSSWGDIGPGEEVSGPPQPRLALFLGRRAADWKQMPSPVGPWPGRRGRGGPGSPLLPSGLRHWHVQAADSPSAKPHPSCRETVTVATHTPNPAISPPR